MAGVNSKAFRSGMPTRSVRTKLLFDELHHRGLEQTSGDSQRAEQKPRFQKNGFRFSPSPSRIDNHAFVPGNDASNDESYRNRANNPRDWLSPDRLANSSRNISFLPNPVQSEREIFPRPRDLPF
jgi:hypothetical protein